MFPGAYAEPNEASERRYLVATLLYDAWLPRALEAQLSDAERKAFYWSGIYGSARTRISEVWVRARPHMRTVRPDLAPRPFQPPPEPMPAVVVTLAATPAPTGGLLGALLKFDRPIDPAYVKAMADAFLLYVGTQIALRMLENLKVAAAFA
jgi:hypothetical protein